MFRIISPDSQRIRKKAVDELTADVKSKMEECVVVIGDERLDVFVANLEKLLQYNLSGQQLGLEKFEMTKDLVDKIKTLSQEDPKSFENIETRLNNQVQRLQRLGLKENRVFEQKIKFSFIGNVFMLLFLSPLFLTSGLVNAVPYAITAYVSRKIQVRDDFVGSLKTVAGMVIFLISYLVTSFVVGSNTTWYFGLITFFLLHPLGLFALFYLNAYYDLIEDYRHTRIFKRKATFIEDLRKERKHILGELNIEAPGSE